MKLDYIKLINQFWQLRRSKRITNLQSDLYFFLLHECNGRYWENPFECSNVLIKASIAISEPSLIDARNRLKQLGLIDFEPGKRKESSPVYSLLYLNNFSKNLVKTLVEPLVKTEEKPEPLLKQNKTEIKPNKKSKSHSGEPVFPFWNELVKIWFDFYEGKFTVKPVFTPKNAGELKKILTALKKISEEKNYAWNEDQAKKVFVHFLTKAFQQSPWLQQNFLLVNLNNQINSIINPTNNGTKVVGITKGGKIDDSKLQSMRDEIDRKYGTS